MSSLLLAFLLSIAFCAVLSVGGVRPYVDEFRSPLRQAVGGLLFVAILTVVVFAPVTSYGNLSSVDLDAMGVGELLFGHVILSVFLLLWWVMRGDVTLARFLSLSRQDLLAKLARGVGTGCRGWVTTILVMMCVVSLVGQTDAAPDPATVPEVMPWMAKLSWPQKALIVTAAMTVEEAFFRAFLQARLGLLLSSMLFALGHFSYGMPFMIVGVLTISLVIGRTFARGGDLLPCIIAHGVFDAVQLFVVLPYAVEMLESGVAAIP